MNVTFSLIVSRLKVFGKQQDSGIRLANTWELLNQLLNLTFTLLEKLPMELKRKFAITLWCIWKRRSEKVWESKTTLPNISISHAMQYLYEWTNACTTTTNSVLNNSKVLASYLTWIKPHHGFVKLDIDAHSTIFNQEKLKSWHYFLQHNGWWTWNYRISSLKWIVKLWLMDYLLEHKALQNFFVLFKSVDLF